MLRRGMQLALDGGAATLALACACLIRGELRVVPWFPQFFVWLPLFAVARPLTLLLSRAYRPTWRHFHLADGVELALKSSLLTVGVLVFRFSHGFGLHIPTLPISIALIELNLFVIFAGSLRIFRRWTHNAGRARNEPNYRTLLVTDETSVAGAVSLIEPYPDVQLVGIITNEHAMRGRTVAGVPILGGFGVLQKMIVLHRVQLVLMTSGGMTAADEIMAQAAELGVEIRILPTARDLVRGRVRVSRSVRIEQMLGTYEQNGASSPVVSCFSNRCVLVTGAGGSIGSEIARQISLLPSLKLILLDQDENSIFELVNELASAKIEIIPRVGDIRDATMLEELFRLHAPDIVLHAAAYKHVPLMESHPCEAILNNVTGTRQLVEHADRFNCERFVMISTDKACSPSNIMGATKRIAEIIVQHRAECATGNTKTQFACVRFGNVVGSRGSVVPTFLRQIEAGGPVTITHEQMTRYFMSIPEAVQLVLQAATLASRGDVYMLDMGDPVKIMDFARKLILMSGLRPDIDVPIQIVGVRPGEKLHERLWQENAEVTSTRFPNVRRIKGSPLQPGISDQILELERAAAQRADQDEICRLLDSLPIDFAEPQPASAEKEAALSLSRNDPAPGRDKGSPKIGTRLSRFLYPYPEAEQPGD
jgi:FlaA1/EpsC-like NDP-sugar epimerase